MTNHLFDKLIANYSDLKHSTVFGILFAISFLVRLPFFFRDYIDRDESTFILMGQSWVEGNLPYTELWDLKPPLAFLFFAVIIYIFGKSFIAIRLAGVLIIAITAFFSNRIAQTLASKKVGLWVGIACVVLQSMFGSIQGVMSEHICMVFFTPAVYLIIKRKEWYWFGIAGVLIGVSCMVKLNLAYPILFLGLYLVYHFIKQKIYGKGVVGVVFYGMGILAVITLTWLPYYLQGLQELWWKSVIIAPLDYTGERRYSFLKLMPTFILIGAFFFFAWKKRYLDFKNSAVQLLLITLLGILYAFFEGGRINSHYLIQLYPIFVVFVGVVFGKMLASAKFKIHRTYLLLLLLIPVESYIEYYRIIKHKITTGSFYNGEGITVPQYLVKNNIDTENILFLEYHIAYWSLDKKPPTKAALHPSNICKPEMFTAYNNPRKTTMEELRFIMEHLKPKTVVTRKNRLVFDKKQEEANNYIALYLPENYTLLKQVGEAEIYQRLQR